jgi:NAD(P)-dependent dehydrogenase (short-subunit alcohol dehydrogenase family)
MQPPVSVPASVRAQFDMTGRVAVITGGAGFLGVQFAEALSELGATSVLLDIAETALARAKARVGTAFPGRCDTGTVDITDKESVAVAVAAVIEKHGRIDVLVNSAALTKAGMEHMAGRFFDSFEAYSKELWDAGLNVNLTGTMLMCQAVGPHMVRRRKGSIVNIASDLAVIGPDQRIYQPDGHGYPGVDFNSPAFYGVSKAGMVQLTRHLAALWGKDNVRVNAVSPAGVYRDHDPGFVRQFASRIMLGRMAVENEFKGAVAFLASDASSFVTGANLMVDGGRTAW